MARKIVENKHRIAVPIAVAGIFISTPFLLAIVFQLRSRIILYRGEPNYDQENMFCGNGYFHTEVNNVK